MALTKVTGSGIKDGTITNDDISSTTIIGKSKLEATPVATGSVSGLMSSTHKSKLDGIADNANNYVKPSNEAISYITGLQSAINAKVSSVTGKSLITDSVLAQLLLDVNALEALVISDNSNLDTLQEIVDFIELNKATLDTLGIANIAGLQNALDGKLSLAGGTLTGNLSLGDNVKAQFGASNDLQIYHDGSYSYIDEVGTGGLNIRTDGLGMSLYHTGGSVNMAQFTQWGASLFFNGSSKLNTNATGIDVTGTVTADGLTFGSNHRIQGTGGLFLGGSTATVFEVGAGSEKMRLTSTGLGIGTSNPAGLIHTSKLADDNTMYIDRYSSNNGHANTIQFRTSQQNTIGNTHTTTGNVMGRLEWYGNTGTAFVRAGYIGVSQGSSTETDGNMTIQAGGDVSVNTGGSEAMRIDSSGSVGIGTSSPNQALDVNGTVVISPNTDGKDTFTLTTNASDDGRFRIKSDTTTKVDIQANGASYFNGGNVGIGMIPAEVLDLKAASGDTRIRLDAATGSDTEIKFFNNGVAQYTIGHDDATDNFVIGTANVDNPKVSINKSGNVGIGTSSPLAKLHIAAGFNPDGVTTTPAIATSGSYGGAISLFDTKESGMYTQANGTLLKFYTGRLNGTNTAASKVVMTLKDGGNVGIGTSSPSDLLELSKSDTTSAFIRMSNSNVSNGWSMGAASAGRFQLTQNGVADRIIVDTSGKVGIGTASPTQKLDVAGTVKATAFVGDGSNLTGIDAVTKAATPPIGVAGDLWYDTVGDTLNMFGSDGEWRPVDQPPASNYMYSTRSDALADNLYAYWDCSSKALTIKKAGGNQGLYYGGVTPEAGGYAGHCWNRGTAASGGASLTGVPTVDLTLSFWFNMTDSTIHSATDGAGVFWPSGDSVNASTILWGYNSSGMKAGGDGWVTSTGTVVIPSLQIDQWYYLTLTKSGNDYKYYVDGVLKHSVTEVVVWKDTWWFSNYSQHGGNTNNHFHRGKLDEIAVWDRTLTEEEVTALYEKYTNGYSMVEDNSGDRFYLDTTLYIRGADLTDHSAKSKTITNYNASSDTTMGAPFAGASSSNFYVGTSNNPVDNYLKVSGPLSDYDPSEGDVTMEFWLARLQNTGSYGHFLNLGGGTSAQSGEGTLKFHGGTGYGLYWYSGAAGGTVVYWNNNYLVADQWDHYVFERRGDINSAYMNGTRTARNNNTFVAGTASADFLGIGLSGNGTEYAGHVFAELRITKAARFGDEDVIPVQSAQYPTE